MPNKECTLSVCNVCMMRLCMMITPLLLIPPNLCGIRHATLSVRKDKIVLSDSYIKRIQELRTKTLSQCAMICQSLKLCVFVSFWSPDKICEVYRLKYKNIKQIVVMDVYGGYCTVLRSCTLRILSVFKSLLNTFNRCHWTAWTNCRFWKLK